MQLFNCGRRCATSVLAVGLLVGVAPAVAAAEPATRADTAQLLCESEQGTEYAEYMSLAVEAAAAASQDVTIGFYDRTTGTTCFTDPFREFKTASIVKVIIAVALQLRAQLDGGRALTDKEQNQLRPMIVESSNEKAIELWQELHIEGPYVNQAIALMGMANTVPGDKLGYTVTTALDQINMLKFLTSPDEEILDRERRDYILHLMSNVIPSQRYGVPVGAPLGATWSNKIGWANLDDSWFNFTTHSIGAIRGPAWNGSRYDYVMALLSNGNFTFEGMYRVSAAAYTINEAKRLRPS